MADVKSDALEELVRSIKQDAAIPADAKAWLLADLHTIATPLHNDPWIYRMVVASLGLTVLASVIGALIITGTSAAGIPEGVVALGSAAVGALAGLLAPSPVTK